MEMKALGNRIIVRGDPKITQTESGIVIPAEAQEKTAFGTVVAVGPRVQCVKAGDRVLYGIYSGRELKDPDTGEEFIQMLDEDIHAVEEAS